MEINRWERLPPRPLIPRDQWGKKAYILDEILEAEVYQNAQTYREQCKALRRFGDLYGLSNNYIVKILGVDHKSYEKQLRLPIEQHPPGRPTCLSEEEVETCYELLNELIENQQFPTIYDTQQLIHEKFDKIVSIQTIYRMIEKSTSLKLITGIPMEADRTQVNQQDIDEYYERLANSVNGVPVSLIFNIDEAGEDDYVDTHSYKVIVPSTIETRTIPIPVRRNTKRSTLLHCICADGTYAKPLLIIPRKTCDSMILKRLCINNTMIKYQKKGYANTQLIKQWVQEVFIPLVRNKRNEEQSRSGYTGNAVLILDGFSSHEKALSEFDLASEHITVVYLVPHASHLTQPLDLVIFSAQKRYTTTRKVCGLGAQADCIRKIIYGLQAASTTENIISAFENAGIIRTFSRATTQSFDVMPLAHVDKGYARFFRDENSSYDIASWRLHL